MMICISACSNIQSPTPYKTKQKPLFLDDEFLGFELVIIETESNIFALDHQMKEMVAKKLLTEKNIKDRALKLIKNIFVNNNRIISYDRNANITAREAYHSNTANCLSLTIMAYALATEAGLNVRFQQIDIPEYWVRNGRYNLLTGHVNLLVNRADTFRKTIISVRSSLQIDFGPQASKTIFKRFFIDKKTVLAMFYNNKGAESLVDGDYISAYSYFKAAALIAPSFSSTWSNLGVLYKLTNQFQEAEVAYHYALNLDHNNLTAMNNLAIILTQQGNIEQAQVIQHKLHLKRSRNPYYFALLADEAFHDGQIEQAIKFYNKAIRLERRVDEFYYRLAQVYFHAEEVALAKKALIKAIAYTKNSALEATYIAKLNSLKQLNNSKKIQ